MDVSLQDLTPFSGKVQPDPVFLRIDQLAGETWHRGGSPIRTVPYFPLFSFSEVFIRKPPLVSNKFVEIGLDQLVWEFSWRM